MALHITGRNAFINQAITFATSAHADQVRKGNEFIPYIFHPIDVANEVIYYSGLPEEEIKVASVVAVLHDVLEDTDVTREQMENEFGKTITHAVWFLTKNDQVAQARQLSESVDKLATAPAYVQCVKLADRISNLKAFPAIWDKARIGKYLDDSVLIAHTLGDASETLNARLLMRVAENRMKLSLYT